MPEYKFEGKLDLEGGEYLLDPIIFYTTYGKLNDKKDNVVWVCHALTADSNVFDWWPGLFGEGELFNPDDHFIVCANMLGSCYGTTGPLSTNPENGMPYFHSFPKLSLRDISRVNGLLANHLQLDRISIVIGGSMGGQQAMEWAIEDPGRFDNLILIATNALHSPWGVAYNKAQRMAIESDATWKNNDTTAGIRGMQAARATALMSYRSYNTFDTTQQSDKSQIWPDKPLSYMDHQGTKLANRFNAFSYWRLSEAMDSHNVGRGRGGENQALNQIEANTLVLALEGDNLFPYAEQDFLSKNIPNASIGLIESTFGHDGFLIETGKLSLKIREFLSRP